MKKILLFVYQTFAELEITVATALLKNNNEIITAQGPAFVPFGIAIAFYFGVANEHNANFYRGNGNIMMEKLLAENVKKLANASFFPFYIDKSLTFSDRSIYRHEELIHFLFLFSTSLSFRREGIYYQVYSAKETC